MVQIEKRQYIWRLNVLSSDICQRIEHFFGPNPIISIRDFLSIIGALGFDCSSLVLADILRLAMTDDSTEIDVSLLFHVIGEAVQKIRDRNVLFWNTVMTITGASISWIDFRRKLSRWLSTNGMGVGHVKNVINFVQQNVDRNSSGIVRKEAFLRFTDDLMGIDCLLSPEGLVALATQPTRVTLPIGKPEQPVPIFYSAQVTAPPFQRQTPPEPVQVAFQQSSAPVNDRIAAMEPLTPIQMPREAVTTSSAHPRADNRESMFNIRIKLGVSNLVKVLSARTKTLFALYRIDAVSRSRSPPVIEPAPSVKSAEIERRPTSAVRKTDCQLMQFAIRLAYIRVLGASFSKLRATEIPNKKLDAGVDESKGSADDESSGPSWTVTIQAVAVSNLFGIMRTWLTRATMPAYFSLKSGHSVDVYNPLRKVLWSQSNQGKKDGLAAASKIPKSTLHPISENTRIGFEDKENAPISELEFDLST